MHQLGPNTGLALLDYEPSSTTYLPRPPFLIQQLILVPGPGDLGVSTAADGPSTDTSNPLPAHCPEDLLYCSLVPALGSWPACTAHPVTLHLPLTVRMHGVVPYTAGLVHSAPLCGFPIV